MPETTRGGRRRGLTVVELDIVLVDKIADGAVDLQVASTTLLVWRKHGGRAGKDEELSVSGKATNSNRHVRAWVMTYWSRGS